MDAKLQKADEQAQGLQASAGGGKPRRETDMKVIGAGFGRTGTLSLHAALEALGLHCYHMNEVLMRWDHLRAWRNFMLRNRPMDWVQLFQGYEATVDFPACVYYKELLQAFPDAVVILSVRDPEKWFASWARMWETKEHYRVFRFIPRLGYSHDIIDHIRDRVFGGRIDRDDNIEAFQRHIQEVKATVPSDRLLVFDVREGWEPLCSFLGLPVPAGRPFPRLNEGTNSIVRKYTLAAVLDVVKVLALVAALGAIAFAAWQALS
jgi:hypothetical protein